MADQHLMGEVKTISRGHYERLRGTRTKRSAAVEAKAKKVFMRLTYYDCYDTLILYHIIYISYISYSTGFDTVYHLRYLLIE